MTRKVYDKVRKDFNDHKFTKCEYIYVYDNYGIKHLPLNHAGIENITCFEFWKYEVFVNYFVSVTHDENGKQLYENVKICIPFNYIKEIKGY